MTRDPGGGWLRVFQTIRLVFQPRYLVRQPLDLVRFVLLLLGTSQLLTQQLKPLPDGVQFFLALLVHRKIQ